MLVNSSNVHIPVIHVWNLPENPDGINYYPGSSSTHTQEMQPATTAQDAP